MQCMRINVQVYLLFLILVGCSDVEWETDIEDGRRDSVASCSTPGLENKKHWDWDTSENARTQQRLKNMKGSLNS